MNISPALLSFLLAMMASSVRALGPRSSFNSRRLDADEPTERECTIESSSSGEPLDGTGMVEFQCKSKFEDGLTEIKDEIKFEVRTTATGLVIEIEYENEMETEAPEEDDGDEEDLDAPELLDSEDEEASEIARSQEIETETKYEVVFDRVIEYSKSPSSSISEAYDWTTDIVVNTVDIVGFQPISEIITEGIVSTFSVTTLDNLFTFSFHISTADMNEAISANKMKIDFEMTNYPWVQENTYMALLCEIESEREVEIDGDDEVVSSNEVIISFQEALAGTGMVPFGEFTWAEDAVVVGAPGADGDNETISVVATNDPDAMGIGGYERMAFSFVGAAAQSAPDIYWDPEAGINYASSSVSVMARALSSAIVALATSVVVVGF